MTRHIPLAFPLVIGAIGLMLIAYSLAALRQARATLGWPSVTGTVLRSQLESGETVREKKQKFTLYNAEVEYGYMVNGKEYVSDRIRFDLQGQPDPADAKRLVDHYPVGS